MTKIKNITINVTFNIPAVSVQSDTDLCVIPNLKRQAHPVPGDGAFSSRLSKGEHVEPIPKPKASSSPSVRYMTSI